MSQPVRPHPEPKTLENIRTLAQNILERPNAYWIFDSETTGLQGEFVEVALLGVDGRVAFSSLVQPVGKIHPAAHAIHGISEVALADAPTWPEIAPTFERLTQGKVLLIYNAKFDLAAYAETNARWGRHDPPMKLGFCVMGMYAQWFGETSPRGGYRWQKLQGGDHTALGDCRATLELIKRMAGAE